MRHLNFIVCWLCLITVAVLTSCMPVSRGQDVNSNRVIYGLTLSPSGFDPHINESSEIGIVLRQVYDTLVYRDPETGQFVPGLAESWAISDDQLSYTLSLKQDVLFHDGTPFNAQAVAANLDRITNPEIRSQRAVLLLGPYAGYEVIDEHTITIRLSIPYGPFLDGLSQVYLGMASPAAFNEYSTMRYQFHQVGTGPFIFAEYIPDTRLVIRRNPVYNWGPSFYEIPSENAIEEVEFRFFTDPSTRLPALESGDVHIMGEIPPIDARALTGSGQIQLIPVGIPGQPLQFLINAQRAPTNNPVFRRALIQATNRQAITDAIFQGFSPIAWGPISRETQFYNRELANTYNFDAQQARAFLATLGYTDIDNNGYLNSASGDVEVVIIVPPWGFVPAVTQLIQDQWRSIGIRAVLRAVPDFPSLLAEIEKGEYNLVAFNSFGLDPAFINSYYVTNGVRNWTRYSNPQLDTLLSQAITQLDPEVRRALYYQVQQGIMDEALILPIRDYVNLNAARATIQNLHFDAYGWFPLLANAQYTGD
jgi:peptide/nickel transport system substrate-binding protein